MYNKKKKYKMLNNKKKKLIIKNKNKLLNKKKNKLLNNKKKKLLIWMKNILQNFLMVMDTIKLMITLLYRLMERI